MLHVLALIFGLAAVGAMVVATAGMVTGRPSQRTGWLLRAGAVACFAAAVAFNVAAH
jgi:hypothetical protein